MNLKIKEEEDKSLYSESITQRQNLSGERDKTDLETIETIHDELLVPQNNLILNENANGPSTK